MPATPQRRDELNRHMARSQAIRRRVLLIGGAIFVAGVAMTFAGLGLPATLTLIAGGVVAGAGSWITWGHIQEFRRELDDMDRPDKRGPVRRSR